MIDLLLFLLPKLAKFIDFQLQPFIPLSIQETGDFKLLLKRVYLFNNNFLSAYVQIGVNVW